MPSGAARDASRDGLRNRMEAALLGGLRPAWAFVNRHPVLARPLNRWVVDNAVRKLPSRPLPLGTARDYPSWSGLTDLTWFSRYLPPRDPDGLPPPESLAPLFGIRPEGPRMSDRSTLLFPAFAQWFTDGFLMTDPDDRRRTGTSHQIDLGQLYGSAEPVTTALRLGSGAAGRKGRLRSVETATGEWAPPLFGGDGSRTAGFEVLPEPSNLPRDWPPEKKATLFAFGGERANSTLFTAAINTLFLREHNRLCGVIEAANSGWDDDRVFETARNVNIVLLIRIVVEEYINHISPYWLQLLADPTPAYRAGWNRPNRIPVEFNLLYRWHSLVPEQVSWDGRAVPIQDCRFDNSRLQEAGLPAAFASATNTRAWSLGLFNTSPMLQPVELLSIRQGRANRLAGYNDYRENARFPRVTRFEQISGEARVVDALQRHYRDVDRIDLFVGLLAEDLPARSAVPPLIGRMVAADAFSHALTNPLLAPLVNNEATFTAAGMRAISETGCLADLVRRNAAVTQGCQVTMEWSGYRSSA